MSDLVPENDDCWSTADEAPAQARLTRRASLQAQRRPPGDQPPPPWKQPRGKWMVSLVNSHTNATRIGWHQWEIDFRFAPGLSPGWEGYLAKPPAGLEHLGGHAVQQRRRRLGRLRQRGLSAFRVESMWESATTAHDIFIDIYTFIYIYIYIPHPLTHRTSESAPSEAMLFSSAVADSGACSSRNKSAIRVDSMRRRPIRAQWNQRRRLREKKRGGTVMNHLAEFGTSQTVRTRFW